MSIQKTLVHQNRMKNDAFIFEPNENMHNTIYYAELFNNTSYLMSSYTHWTITIANIQFDC